MWLDVVYGSWDTPVDIVLTEETVRSSPSSVRTLEAQREALRILLLNHSLEAIGEAQFAAITLYLDIYEAVDGRKRLAEWEFLSELEGVLRPQPRPEQPPASFTVRRGLRKLHYVSVILVVLCV